jgi:hypothetical protein
MSDETVCISVVEYKELLRDSRMLSALHNGGVDNWEWYDESLKSFWDEEEEE